MNSPDHAVIEARILALTAARGPEKSICPSEVARSMVPDESWRQLLRPVRDAAARLAQAGLIEMLRKGRPIEPGAVKGVVRLRAKEQG